LRHKLDETSQNETKGKDKNKSQHCIAKKRGKQNNEMKPWGRENETMR
jgi:hypothetical protein